MILTIINSAIPVVLIFCVVRMTYLANKREKREIELHAKFLERETSATEAYRAIRDNYTFEDVTEDEQK